jgi:hypothetical protein
LTARLPPRLAASEIRWVKDATSNDDVYANVERLEHLPASRPGSGQPVVVDQMSVFPAVAGRRAATAARSCTSGSEKGQANTQRGALPFVDDCALASARRAPPASS